MKETCCCGKPVGKGTYVVLRSTEKEAEVRTYTVDSKRTADKLAEDFTLLGFSCKVIDVDDECMRA